MCLDHPRAAFDGCSDHVRMAIWAVRPYCAAWLDVPALALAAHVMFGVFVYAIALHTVSRQYFADLVESRQTPLEAASILKHWTS